MTRSLTIEPDKAQEEDTPRGCGPLIEPGTRTPSVSLRRQLYETIRAQGQIARVELARQLDISPASVTSIAGELIEKGLIEERARPRDPSDGQRGRPPVALGVRADAGYVVGIKISDTVNTAIVVDFSGARIADAALPSPGPSQEVGRMVHAIAELLASVLDKANLPASAVAAVGVGVPGLVEAASGRVMWSPMFIDRGVPLADELTGRLGIPARIDNDANLVTLAELWFGAGRSQSNFAVVTIEHGVGMGLVIDHQLYRGGEGIGLELGHVKVQMDGALCRCGQRGCLEAYVADYALVREATTALNWDQSLPKTVQLESLFDHAKAGNAGAKAIFARAGRFLALGLANVINLFDPALLLISGERLRFDLLYAEEVLSEMRALTLNPGRKPPPVKIHTWGDLIWAHGAAALALEAATIELLEAAG